MSVIDPVTDEALANYTRAGMALSPYRDALITLAQALADRPG